MLGKIRMYASGESGTVPEQNPNASRLDGEGFWETGYRGLVRVVAFGLGTGWHACYKKMMLAGALG